MFFEVTNARYVKDYQIELHFEDGASGIVDLTKHLEPDTVLEVLRDEKLFRSFSIKYGTLVWKNGDIDLAPETLYVEATGREIQFRQAAGRAS